MSKSITTLASLLDTRRLLRTIRLSTNNYTKDLQKAEQSWNKSNKRMFNNKNNNTRLLSEKIYREGKRSIKLLEHIELILKTHLHEATNLNSKMLRQTATLLAENRQLVKIAESVMEAMITSTQPDTPLNTITTDLTKKFSRDLNVVCKMITIQEKPCGILVLKSPHSTDTVYAMIISDEEGHRHKTFMNELPVDISDKNFVPFLSPSQAYKQISDVLRQDGVLR